MFYTENSVAQTTDWATKIPDAWIKYKALKPINDQVALYYKGELWGLVQNDGHELVPATYSNLFVSESFPDAIAIGDRNENSKIIGLLSLTGQVIVPPVYATVHRLPNGTIRACGEDYDCQDFSPIGALLKNPILQQYKSNGIEQNGLLCASEDGVRFGLLDAEGKWAIAPEHPPLWPHPSGWWTYYNAWDYSRLLYPDLTTQETLFLKDVYPLSDGNYWKMSGGTWRQYDKSGRLVAPLTGFEPNRYANPHIIIRNGNKKGLTDLSGKVVLEPLYRSVDYQTTSKVYIVIDDMGRKGVWLDGTFRIPMEYDEITFCAPQFFAIKGDQTSIFSSNFEPIVTIQQRIYAEPYRSFQFDKTVIPSEFNMQERKALPENRKLWHFKNGLIPIPDKAIAIKSNVIPHYIMEDGTQALCNDTGLIILENCDEITIYRTFNGQLQLFLFRKNNLWGWTDRHGKILLDAQFEQLIPLQYGYFLAQKDLFWGVLDAKGAWIVAPTYDSYLEKPILGLRKNKLWRIFDVESGQLSDVDLEHYKEIKGGLQGTINGTPVALSSNGQQLPYNVLHHTEKLSNSKLIIKEENGRKALFSAQGKALSPFAYKVIHRYFGRMTEMHIWADLIEGGNVLFDTSGKELIRMDSIIPLAHAFYSVQNNGKWEVLGRNLQPIGTFNAISPILYHLYSGRFIAEIAKDSWIIKDLNDRTLTTFRGKIRKWSGSSSLEIEQERQIRYQSLYHVDESPLPYDIIWKTQGFSMLKKDSLFYIQKPNGEPLVEGRFEKWGYLLGHGDMLTFQRKDSILIMDLMGKIRLPLCAKAVYALNGLINYLPSILQLNSASGTEIWNTKNDRMVLSNSYQVVLFHNKPFILNQGKDNRYNLYDTQLQPILPESADQIKLLSTHLIAVQNERDGKYRIYNMKERKYTGQVYMYVTNRANDFWRTFENGEYLMYHDTLLLFRRKCKSVDRVGSNNQRSFLVEDENGWQLIDYKGNVLCPEYFTNKEFSSGDFLTVTKKDKKGVLSHDGTFLLLTEYDQIIADTKFKVFWVKKNGLWGYIRRDGKVALPIEFQEFKYHKDDGLCIGVKNGRYGFYSISGKQHFGRDWEYADQFSEGLAAVRDNGKWGYINTAGAIVIPCSFDYAHRFRPSFRSATVMEDGQFWDINDRGEKIRATTSIPDYGYHFSPLDLLPNKADFEDYVNVGTGWQIYRQKSTNKYGLMDYSGTIRLQPEYEQLDYEHSEKGVWIKGKKNGKVVKFAYGLERMD